MSIVGYGHEPQQAGQLDRKQDRNHASLPHPIDQAGA